MNDIPKISSIISAYINKSVRRDKPSYKTEKTKNGSSGNRTVSLEELVARKIAEINRGIENYADIALKVMVETIIMEKFGEFGRNNPDTEKVIENTINAIKQDKAIHQKYIDNIKELGKQ
jgi:hypothetical protein